MKRRILVAFILVVALCAWPVSVQAVPIPEIHIDPDMFFPHVDPDLLDLFTSLQEVDIPDDNLRDSICDLLGIPHGDPITRGDMASAPLEGSVNLSEKGIRNLEGMQFAVNMQSLELKGNPIEQIPEEMADLDKLLYMGLAECGLSEVPANLWDMQYVKYLYLDDNQLTELPASIGSMDQLVVLSVAGNQLGALPDNIGSLLNLEVLIALDNQISAWPETLKNCTKLRELCLTGNQLTEVPDWIGSMTQLALLFLEGNEIGSVPGSMASLDAVAALSLKFNRIKEIPPCLSEMDHLQALYIGANDIKILPGDLPDWELAYIDLEWNDLDLNDPMIKSVLEGLDARGTTHIDELQKPVPVLTADASQEGVVKLGWPLITDSYGVMYTYTIEGLKLQRRTGSGSYATIANMGAGATGYEDGDIEPGNTYTYKITARYNTDTNYFSHVSYRVATCDAEIPPAAVEETQEAMASPGTSGTPGETEQTAVPPGEGQEGQEGQEDQEGENGNAAEAAKPSGGGLNQGLFIGLVVLVVLLVGVLTALIIILARRNKGNVPYIQEQDVTVPPDTPEKKNEE